MCFSRPFLLLLLGNHRLGRDQQARDRRRVLQRRTHDLRRVDDAVLDCPGGAHEVVALEIALDLDEGARKWLADEGYDVEVRADSGRVVLVIMSGSDARVSQRLDHLQTLREGPPEPIAPTPETRPSGWSVQPETLCPGFFSSGFPSMEYHSQVRNSKPKNLNRL